MKKVRIIATLITIVAASCSPPQEVESVTSALLAPVVLDGTSGSCTSQGWTWDGTTKTCTMTNDVISRGIQLVLGSINTTLDCANNDVCYMSNPSAPCSDPDTNNNVADGILVTQNNVTVKNCNLHGYFNSIHATAGPGVELSGLTIKNVTIGGSSHYGSSDPSDGSVFGAPARGLWLERVVSSLIEDVIVTKTSSYGIDAASTFRNNTVRNVTMVDNIGSGMTLGAGSGPNTGNLVEDVTFIRSETKRAHDASAVISRVFDSTFTRIGGFRVAGTVGYQVGFYGLNGSNVLVQDSTFEGATRFGIQVPSTGSFTVSGNSVTSSAGGVLLPSNSPGAVTLVGNTLCLDSSMRNAGGVPSPNWLNVMTADVTTLNKGGTPSTVLGSGNRCGIVNSCFFIGPAYTCLDGGPGSYQDIGAPTGQPCTFTCP